MTRTKLDTPAFADQSVDSRNIADGTIQAQDISGSITGTQLAGSISNDKLAYNKFTLSGKEASLGASISVGVLVDWQAVTVADGSTQLTAEAGKGYFLDTNTGVIEVFLPSSPTRGDVIILVDYSGTFATNMAIINTGGQLIDSTSGPDFSLKTNNTIAELVYVDSNKGWQVILNQAAGTTPDSAFVSGGGYDTITYINATGGTITTSGDDRIHTFTGDGNFVVSSVGNAGGGGDKVSYLVIAGGGGGGGSPSPGGNGGGGGGAGGFREGKDSPMSSYTVSPLNAPAGLTVAAGTYPITVGAGASGGSSGTHPGGSAGRGSNSVFSTITSTGGGGGAAHPISSTAPTQPGGSGGGSSQQQSPGAGNTPPVSPPQGNNSTPASSPNAGGSGGGGSGGTNPGSKSPASAEGTPGGAGVTTNITGSGVQRAAGGAGGGQSAKGGDGGAGGGGGGGGAPRASGNGTANTGSGGGGGGFGGTGGNGGKGLVVIRYKIQG
jgi:hypothetical protein